MSALHDQSRKRPENTCTPTCNIVLGQAGKEVVPKRVPVAAVVQLLRLDVAGTGRSLSSQLKWAEWAHSHSRRFQAPFTQAMNRAPTWA